MFEANFVALLFQEKKKKNNNKKRFIKLLILLFARESLARVIFKTASLSKHNSVTFMCKQTRCDLSKAVEISVNTYLFTVVYLH